MSVKSLPRNECYLRLASPSGGIYAVNAIVKDGLNRDRIEPPQPTLSLISQQIEKTKLRHATRLRRPRPKWP